jgi:hypothetical protein
MTRTMHLAACGSRRMLMCQSEKGGRKRTEQKRQRQGEDGAKRKAKTKKDAMNYMYGVAREVLFENRLGLHCLEADTSR